MKVNKQHNQVRRSLLLSVSLLVLCLANIAIAKASTGGWIPAVTEYVNNEGLTKVTPQFTALPNSDTDGYFEVQWQGETPEFTLEIAQLESASPSAKLGYSSTPKWGTKSSKSSSSNWQTVYSGGATSTSISGLAEGTYVFRLTGCRDLQCTESVGSENVVIVYDLTPNKDYAFVRANGNAELRLLANDRDPSKPGVSIYTIVDEIIIDIPPRAGFLTVNGTNVQYTNTSAVCTSSTSVFDYFYYRIVDINGVISDPVEVAIEILCNDTYYVPTWVEVVGAHADFYDFFEGSDGFYLRAKASNWASLGFLTIAQYKDQDYLKLVNVAGQWQAQASSASAFNSANTALANYAQQGTGSVGGNPALNLAFAGGDSIRITWPEAKVGQQIAPSINKPANMQCVFNAINTNNYRASAGNYVFYQPGSYKGTWRCSGAGTGAYDIETVIDVNSLSAPTGLEVTE